MSQFTQQLANICLGEYARWDNGAGKETQGTDDHFAKDYYLFVRDYWRSVGINHLDGRTVQDGIRPAWSSAFISFCVKQAGAGARFKYTQAHCHYIAEAMKAADGSNANFAYVAKKAAAHKPAIGDIVCGGREYAKRYDYDQAKLVYEADTFYPSHGDIVVDVDAAYATVIGGNVNQNVDRKRLPLDGSGFLKQRVVGTTSYPWIAILSCQI